MGTDADTGNADTGNVEEYTGTVDDHADTGYPLEGRGAVAGTGTVLSPAPRAGGARVALVGVHGFGVQHLRNLERLRTGGFVNLVAVADPIPPGPGTLPPATAVFESLDDLLAQTPDLDVVIVATPIQTHAPLALAALKRADVYLEKPPVASLADFRMLQEAAASAGRSVQVGFQSLGSHALEAIRDLMAGGEIGTLMGVTATGRWVRDRAYYKRSLWAGQRSLNGIDVVDGVATNPLAHAIATALRIADAPGLDDLASVETDLYRANDIDADDTSVIRLRTVAGLPITCALTLCATHPVEPYITLQGSEGTAVFHYTEDRLSVLTVHGERRAEFGRDDLLENLLEHLAHGSPLLSPLAESGAFMRVLEAVRTAEPPALIPQEYVHWEGEGAQAHAVVVGIEDALERATTAHATFNELGLPWARPPGPPLATLETSDGGVLAVLRPGTGIASRLSPRPYLHPVRTLAGVTVSDHFPADHSWHLGVALALQDVNGTNFWGGKTYTRSTGRYEERDDHGVIRSLRTSSSTFSSKASSSLTPATAIPSSSSAASHHRGLIEQELSWQAPDGSELLTEHRLVRSQQLDNRSWRLDVETELTAVVRAFLGSPGSNGAAGSGYGGFFWRLPACEDAEVFTPEHRGEAAVHGSVSPWLAWTADFDGGPASLVFAAPPQTADPWFVRMADYPGVGSALAWDRPLELAAGDTLIRTFRVWICDGRLTPSEAAALASQR
jgi:predicted dehydrogenase